MVLARYYFSSFFLHFFHPGIFTGNCRLPHCRKYSLWLNKYGFFLLFSKVDILDLFFSVDFAGFIFWEKMLSPWFFDPIGLRSKKKKWNKIRKKRGLIKLFVRSKMLAKSLTYCHNVKKRNLIKSTVIIKKRSTGNIKSFHVKIWLNASTLRYFKCTHSMCTCLFIYICIIIKWNEEKKSFFHF